MVCTILVKPKNKQTAVQTKEQLKRHINPVNINIKSMKEKRDGSIAVFCRDEKSIECIKDGVENKLNNECETLIPETKKPKLLIVGLSENYNEEELFNKIVNQNVIKIVNEFKIIRIFKTKNEYFNAVVELNLEDFKNSMSIGKMRIGWDICKIFENYNIRRCFNCLGFNHKAEYCKKKPDVCCNKCGDNHLANKCQSGVLKCINCIRSNEKYGLDLNIDHSVYDKKCPTFQRKIMIEQRKNFQIQAEKQKNV